MKKNRKFVGGFLNRQSDSTMPDEEHEQNSRGYNTHCECRQRNKSA